MIVNITLHPFRAHCSGEIVHAVQSLMSLSFDMPTDEILDSKMRDGLEYRTVRTSFGKDVVPPYVKVFNADGH